MRGYPQFSLASNLTLWSLFSVFLLTCIIRLCGAAFHVNPKRCQTRVVTQEPPPTRSQR